MTENPPENTKFNEGVASSLELAKQELLEDLEIEKQMTHYNTFRNIPKTEFPLFLTVRKLIYMLDGN